MSTTGRVRYVTTRQSTRLGLTDERSARGLPVRHQQEAGDDLHQGGGHGPRHRLRPEAGSSRSASAPGPCAACRGGGPKRRICSGACGLPGGSLDGARSLARARAASGSVCVAACDRGNFEAQGKRDLQADFLAPAEDTLAWMKQAACAGMAPRRSKGEHKDPFFPRKGESTAEGKEICNSCIVRPQCLIYSEQTGSTDGMWAAQMKSRRK